MSQINHSLHTSSASSRFSGLPLDKATRAFVEQLEHQAAPPLQELSLEEARRSLVDLQDLAGARRPEATIEDNLVPTGPTGSVPVRIVRPPHDAGRFPAVVYAHGGGWVLGDPHTHDRLIRELAVRAQAAVVFVDYARAPETRYPIQNQQMFAVLQWVADNADSMGIDASRLAVAGDSSGANMATVVTMMAKDHGGPKLAAQVLLCPTTAAGFDTPSAREFADGPFLDERSMRFFWDAYLPDHSRRHEPTASPLSASRAQLEGLPPALVVTAELDPLRDEGEQYAHNLAQAGVPVTATRYLGTIHEFMVLDPLAATPPAKAAIAEVSTFLSDRLNDRDHSS